MCMSHAPAKAHQPGGWKKKEKAAKKHTPFDESLMKPDPDFVDERIEKREKPKGFLDRLANIFD
ncbi:hypothetical protein [Hydrogenimonas cancrithermarum]|uniref:Uncharacterized protein n=1 Tax=Hydrogenimonas cancrithermarum TaxID=2993563 RepID=A0ABN6WVX9_9BACT|nr:hypothetical protein [Hydrogenimonas cancrithermarum]BDY12352.1 hypothetical protein HCR_06640 [Hydrogenimonas cancrithermarum]